MVQKQLSTVCNEPGCVPVTLYLWICCCLVTKLCSLSCVWFIWDLVNCSLPGSSVHRISQARILECVAISFSRGLNPHLLHWPDSLPLSHQGNQASLTEWTWVRVNSGSWWWTGRPGVLESMGSQRVGHDWATELNWPWKPLTCGYWHLDFMYFSYIMK